MARKIRSNKVWALRFTWEWHIGGCREPWDAWARRRLEASRPTPTRRRRHWYGAAIRTKTETVEPAPRRTAEKPRGSTATPISARRPPRTPHRPRGRRSSCTWGGSLACQPWINLEREREMSVVVVWIGIRDLWFGNLRVSRVVGMTDEWVWKQFKKKRKLSLMDY